MTAGIIENHESFKTRYGPFTHLLDQAGVTGEVLAYAYVGQGTAASPFIVEFLPRDPYNPLTFAKGKRWVYTMIMAIAALAVSFSSSAFSSATADIMSVFHVSTYVAILGVSLFVLGFTVGSLSWAPSSEFYGRQIIFFVTYLSFAVLNAGTIGSKNIETLLVLRFLAGCFGSSVLTNAGAVVADMFGPNDRALALAILSGASFLGPSLGPIVSGFLVEATGWNWNQGLMAIFSGIVFLVGTLIVPETYTPYLLRTRAAKLSKLTGKVFRSKLDTRPISMTEQFKVTLQRPWLLLLREPIVLLSSIYIAIVYGTLYMSFASYPIIFAELRGWSPSMTGLTFVGIAGGVIIAVLYYAFIEQGRYLRVAEAYGGRAPPEARLPPAILGSVLLPIGLFWFAWTNGPEINWAVPVVGTGFFGAGFIFIFLSLTNYLVDSYVIFAASALAANSIIRSVFGAAFPLIALALYSRLNIHWASSIPAFLSVLCLPCPFLFYRYGERIRSKCKYSAEAASLLRSMLNAPEARTQGSDVNKTEIESGMTELDENLKTSKSMDRVG
ncbi:MFS general substrate transporter [Xylaria cubensis]|nr:MFS general substrate transporter [Xylaria cubensis]